MFRLESDADGLVEVWWWAMFVWSTANMALLFAACRCNPAATRHETKAQRLTLLCAIGTVYRCTFPVVWEARPHGCMFATPGMLLGSEMFDQVCAQVAECTFAMLVSMQVALGLSCIGAEVCSKVAGRAFWAVWLVARPCCWLGVTTDNKLFHVFEEGVWSVFAAVLLSAIAASAPWRQQRSHVRRILALAMIGLLAYLWFMVTVDVPMYYYDWRADVATGFKPGTVEAGLAEMMQCDAVVQDYATWREGIPWQTGYFGFLPLVAISLGIVFRAPQSTGIPARAVPLKENFEGLSRAKHA